MTAPSNCQVEFAKKKFDWPIRPVVSDAERSRSAPSACFRHSDFCWKARSRFVLAIALELLIAFVERATANMGDFQLSDGDAPTVAEICRKLDGLPVARLSSPQPASLRFRSAASRHTYTSACDC